MDQRSRGRGILQERVEHFQANRASYMRHTYNESQLRTDFLNPFLDALGWDVQNDQRQSQRLREVIVEEPIIVAGEAAKKKPDFTLRRHGDRLFFVEAKKPHVSVLTARDPAFQTRRYGWSAAMTISVLTNFDKLIIYDCTRPPLQTDEANICRVDIYDHSEYLARFDEIYDKLSRQSAYCERFDEIFGEIASRSGNERFDTFFLRQIEAWRKQLAESLAASNLTLNVDELSFLVQRLLNRIIFLRICEDRQQETYERLRRVQNYEQLKTLFRDADRRYNSGLFDFLDDRLSFSVEVDSATLIDIFDQLYTPHSPYNFAVVEPGVLGEIYERFLANQVTVAQGRHVDILPKPEVVHSGGVISTPKQVADRIVTRTLEPLCAEKTIDELKQLRIADIACGSGVFLLSAYGFLIDARLDWYIQNGPELWGSAVRKSLTDDWHLTLTEKHDILKNCIYGVDVDIQAVEITRFGLLLKVLENEDGAYIDAQLEISRGKALPNLDTNIQCGNSLIDSTFFLYDTEQHVSDNQLVAINPFDWKDAFPAIMGNGGFDAIVGNPPYIRIQSMVLYSPKEIGYFQSSASPYSTARQDNFDKYALFVERAISLLKPEGRLGYIVPNKFFTIRAGKALRTLLSEGKYVEYIVHFGVQQVFVGRLTYTCVLQLSKRTNPVLTVEHVLDVLSWKQGGAGARRQIASAKLGDDPWVFVSPQLQALFDRVNQSALTTTLGGSDGVADIFVGVQTSADRIYIIKPINQQGNFVSFTDTEGQTHQIESEILRPCLLDAPIEPFGTPVANRSIIFPYRIANGVAVVYTAAEMQMQFPLCWAYLQSYEEMLKARSLSNAKRGNVNAGTPDAWYRFGRSQSLTEFDGRPKIIWPVLSLEPRYGYDAQDVLFTGGGNGPYYALRSAPGSTLSLHYLMAVLSHPFIERMVRSSGSWFQGGYVSHGKQFLEPLPVPRVDASDATRRAMYETIVLRTPQLVQSVQDAASATTPQIREIHRRRSVALRRQVEEAVGSLYGLTAADMALLAAPDQNTDADSPPTDGAAAQ